MGETAPGAGGEAEPKPEEPAVDGGDEEVGGGGLLAALRKNKNKKAKKGKPANDFVEGEDPEQEANGAADLDSKKPQEGSFEDDEEDVFAGNQKSAKAAAAAAKAKKAAEEPEGDGFRVKTKKEKEKEKKEREKQRKREQVSFFSPFHFVPMNTELICLLLCLGRQ